MQSAITPSSSFGLETGSRACDLFVLAAVEKVNHAALNDARRPVQSGEAVGTRQLDRSAGWKGLACGPTSRASETGWVGWPQGKLKGRNRGGPLDIVGAAWTAMGPELGAGSCPGCWEVQYRGVGWGKH